jgi:hypothetical protein
MNYADEILNLRQAAETIKVSMALLKRLVSAKQIEAKDLGRGRGNGLRFVRKHLLKYMEKEASKNKPVELAQRKNRRKALIHEHRQ